MIKMGDIITLGCLYIFRRCVFMGHPTGSKSVGFDGNLTLFCILKYEALYPTGCICISPTRICLVIDPISFVILCFPFTFPLV